MHITGLFHRFFKFLVLNFLYYLILKILSFDLGKPDSIASSLSRKILSNFTSPRYSYNELCLQSDLPPAQKLTTLTYLEILKTEQAQGNFIQPVKHRKPIPKNLSCPSCGAPYKFIYSNAPTYSPQAKKFIQKYRCKICARQWLAGHARKSPVFACPFCQAHLQHWITRQEFDKYKCHNPACPFFRQHHHPYVYRDYFFDVYKLQLASPGQPLVDLSRIHYSSSVLGLALTLNVNFGLSSRLTARFFKDLLGINIAHSTIYTWNRSVAALLAPLVCKLPVTASNILVADETYERYAGYWGYYYALLDGINRFLIAPHFSPKRNVQATATLLVGGLKRIKNPPPQIYLVHDYYPTYFLAVQLINQSGMFPFKLISLPIKGLKDEPDQPPNPYRRLKNIIERYFGTVKPDYYETRGYGTLQGAVAHNILRGIDYNYFRPHQLYHHQPPLQIEGLKSNHPIEKWNRLIEMATGW